VEPFKVFSCYSGACDEEVGEEFASSVVVEVCLLVLFILQVEHVGDLEGINVEW
jgi:hypothetical protein